GGPVLHKGELVGISRLQDDKSTYLIPLSAFRGFLNQHVFFDCTARLFKETAMSLSRSVYISYSWKAEDENDTVEKLLAAFTKQGFEIKRDIDGVGYGASIRAYMDELAAGGAIILVLSEPYFKSPNCMYELLEIYRNNRKEFLKRIFPVVLQGTLFHRAIDRIPYIKFWENAKRKLNEGLSSVSRENISSSTQQELRDYADFGSMIDELQSLIGDMNHLTEEEHLNTNFSFLIERVIGIDTTNVPDPPTSTPKTNDSSNSISEKKKLENKEEAIGMSEEIAEVEELLKSAETDVFRKSLEERLTVLKHDLSQIYLK
ncbi:MAG: toll/interleukin-1 receptor domain-containing protein, partial [Candidatus Electrothrix sp. AR1]|nr:toll/interleukin-1 receptor domain-containing protein [Candidatus Electrothrix sp. AR1]